MELFIKAVKIVNEYNDKIEKKYNDEFEEVSIESLNTSVDLKDLLKIIPIPVHVIAGMARLPSDYAYWASVKSELTDVQSDLQYEYDVWHANRYDEVCEGMSELKATERTETRKEVEIIVQFGDDMKSKKEELAKVASAIRKTKLLLKALEMKKDMLQSIGAILRQEIEQLAMVDGAIGTSRDTGSKSLSDINKKGRRRKEN